ncbi:MAG: PD-(D/E)XK nuclease family protein [Phycisphaerae bacterium]
MSVEPGKSELFGQILASKSRAVVLRGPAASGKTTAVLGMYGHFAGADGSSRCMVVAPNSPAVADLKRQLLAASAGGVVIAPKVLTFAALADRILAACRHPARQLPAFRRWLLLRRIVGELAGAGKLPAMAAVADTPGIIVALDRAIAELKRAAVDPEDLARALGPTAKAARPDKSRDLLEVYQAYQARLQADGAYDLEGQMWQARDCLAAAQSQPNAAVGLEDVAAMAVDGFTDFTPTQLEILALLAPRMEKLLITLAHADDGRKRLWHWTGRTLANIRRAFGQDLTEIHCLPHTPADDNLGVPLSSLWKEVFDIDARAEAFPGGFNIIAAAGVEAEVSAVARRIKAMLVAEGKPVRIAVLARSMDEYRPAIERIFAAHDIPVAAGPTMLTDVPLVRFALDAATISPELAFGDVLRVIKNSYFRPQALGPFDASTVAAAEMLIREGNVLSGRQAYADAVKRLARRLEAQRAAAAEDDEEAKGIALGPLVATGDELTAAAQMLEKLFDVCERCDLAGLVEALDLRTAALAGGDPVIVARDLRALAALQDALAAMREDSSGSAASPPLADIREALAAISCPGPRGEAMVDVLDVLDARAIRYDHVFLLGVSEGQFPRRFTDSPLVGEAERAAWAARDIRLDSRGDLLAREMLLFYLAVSRADAGLTVSFLESDASGKPGAASNFLLSLVGPAGGLAKAQAGGIVHRIPQGQFVPPADEISSVRDAFNAAIAGLFDAGAGPDASALAWAASAAPRQIARAAMGIWARHRRWQRGPCNEFDGRLTDERLMDALGRRFGGEQAVFSASQFNTYGQCPWQFFATHVLGLAPLEEPQRELEAVAAGIFCHEVLFGWMRLLAGRHGLPVRLNGIAEADAMAALDEAISAEASRVEARRPPYPLLWRLQLAELTRRLRHYAATIRARGDAAGGGIHFELSFGRDIRDAEDVDPASTPTSVAIDTSAGKIHLAGKIDRVDLLDIEGRPAILVIDYKTGRLPSARDIVEGRSLQLPLYQAAAGELLAKECLGGVVHRVAEDDGPFERYFAAVKLEDGVFVEDGKFPDARREAMACVGRFVEGMRRGHFDLLPTGRSCPAYCPFRQVCQFSPARQELRAADEEAPEGTT